MMMTTRRAPISYLFLCFACFCLLGSNAHKRQGGLRGEIGRDERKSSQHVRPNERRLKLDEEIPAPESEFGEASTLAPVATQSTDASTTSPTISPTSSPTNEPTKPLPTVLITLPSFDVHLVTDNGVVVEEKLVREILQDFLRVQFRLKDRSKSYRIENVTLALDTFVTDNETNAWYSYKGTVFYIGDAPETEKVQTDLTDILADLEGLQSILDIQSSLAEYNVVVTEVLVMDDEGENQVNTVEEDEKSKGKDKEDGKKDKDSVNKDDDIDESPNEGNSTIEKEPEDEKEDIYEFYPLRSFDIHFSITGSETNDAFPERQIRSILQDYLLASFIFDVPIRNITLSLNVSAVNPTEAWLRYDGNIFFQQPILDLEVQEAVWVEQTELLMDRRALTEALHEKSMNSLNQLEIIGLLLLGDMPNEEEEDNNDNDDDETGLNDWRSPTTTTSSGGDSSVPKQWVYVGTALIVLISLISVSLVLYARFWSLKVKGTPSAPPVKNQQKDITEEHGSQTSSSKKSKRSLEENSITEDNSLYHDVELRAMSSMSGSACSGSFRVHRLHRLAASTSGSSVGSHPKQQKEGEDEDDAEEHGLSTYSLGQNTMDDLSTKGSVDMSLEVVHSVSLLDDKEYSSTEEEPEETIVDLAHSVSLLIHDIKIEDEDDSTSDGDLVDASTSGGASMNGNSAGSRPKQQKKGNGGEDSTAHGSDSTTLGQNTMDDISSQGSVDVSVELIQSGSLLDDKDSSKTKEEHKETPPDELARTVASLIRDVHINEGDDSTTTSGGDLGRNNTSVGSNVDENDSSLMSELITPPRKLCRAASESALLGAAAPPSPSSLSPVPSVDGITTNSTSTEGNSSGTSK